jgi:hypothetical protein
MCSSVHRICHFSTARILTLVLLIMTFPLVSQADYQIFEKFSYDPGWDGVNNRTSPQNFGYSLTNHTGGGDSFEAGGTIVREDNPKAYYGANIGTLDLTHPLKMTGALNPHTPGGGTIFIGFFNNTNFGYPQNNTLGLYLDGQNTFTNAYIRAVNSAGTDERVGPVTTFSTNTDLKYDLRYNPSGGSGNGQLTLIINGGTPFVTNLPSGFKTSGASFNRFGIHNVGVDGGPFDAFIDDVTYTSSVPKVERFTVDPGWDGHNNRSSTPAPQTITQNFGYKTTNNAGGSAGEVGGLIQPAGEAAYYAKSISNRTLTQTNTSTGKFKVSGGGNTLLGFFNSSTVNEWRTPQSLALRIYGRGDHFLAYPEYGTSKWRAGANGFPDGAGGEFHFPTDVSLNYSLSYSPTANGGNGALTATIWGGGIGTQTVVANLDAGHKADGATFNRFGLLNVNKSADGAGSLWIDNVNINGTTTGFNTNPNWTTLNNNTTYTSNNVRFRFDFGHATSNFAGGAGAGEIGGNFFRGDSRQADTMAFYGDVLADESFNFDTPLHAEGKIAFKRGVTDSTVHIGFFHNTDSVKVSQAQAISTPEDFIGATVEGPSSEGFYFYPSYGSDVEGSGSGGNRGIVTPPHIYPNGATHNWTLDYDPNGGGGLGQIIVSLDGVQGIMNIDPSHRALGAHYTRFGFITPHIDGNGQTVFLDDLIYTQSLLPISTPEPASALVLAAGLFLSIRHGRKAFNREE